MRRNIEGLQRSTILRSRATLERAQTAIRRMQAQEIVINFRTVAAQAGVSHGVALQHQAYARPHHEAACLLEDPC